MSTALPSLEDDLIADGRAPLLPSDLVETPWPREKKRLPVRTFARSIIEHRPRHRYAGIYRIAMAVWRALDPSQGGQPIERDGYVFSTEINVMRPSYRVSVSVLRRPVAALARAA